MQVPIGIWSYGHAYANGKIYVIGGVHDNLPSSAVYAYDVASDTWSAPLAPLPQPEFYTACGVIDNKIYVAGGGDGDNVRNNLYIYDIATNSWTSRNTHAGRRRIPGWRGRQRQTLGDRWPRPVRDISAQYSNL